MRPPIIGGIASRRSCPRRGLDARPRWPGWRITGDGSVMPAERASGTGARGSTRPVTVAAGAGWPRATAPKSTAQRPGQAAELKTAAADNGLFRQFGAWI